MFSVENKKNIDAPKIMKILLVAVLTIILFTPVSGKERPNAIISFDCELHMRAGEKIQIDNCEITGLQPIR